MGKFLNNEKPKQAAFKASSSTISAIAKCPGRYKNHLYDYCLPVEYAIENLFPPIREPLLAYFQRKKIKWHDGHGGYPSNHMCDSQVCCANFLFPFADQPGALAAMLKPVFPLLDEMLPLEEGLFVNFEWIGECDYLGETRWKRNKKRSRGALYTSVDAMVMFRRIDGKRQISLIEWKYTESYSNTSYASGASGETRKTTYRKFYDRYASPLNTSVIPCYEALFYEPFYQLMRQQFLANEMEKAAERGADIVSLLHISPAHNRDFCRITSPELQKLGGSAIDIWKNLIRFPDRFYSISTEALFECVDESLYPNIADWKRYMAVRYPWLNRV